MLNLCKEIDKKPKIRRHRHLPPYKKKLTKGCYKCFRVVTEEPLIVTLEAYRLGTFTFRY